MTVAWCFPYQFVRRHLFINGILVCNQKPTRLLLVRCGCTQHDLENRGGEFLRSRESYKMFIWVFPKFGYPTTMGFPTNTKNDHFGGVLGVPLFSETPIWYLEKIIDLVAAKNSPRWTYVTDSNSLKLVWKLWLITSSNIWITKGVNPFRSKTPTSPRVYANPQPSNPSLPTSDIHHSFASLPNQDGSSPKVSSIA